MGAFVVHRGVWSCLSSTHIKEEDRSALGLKKSSVFAADCRNAHAIICLCTVPISKPVLIASASQCMKAFFMIVLNA